MKKILLLLAIATSSLVYSQDTDTTKIWTTGGQIGINASQIGFYNWSKGGDNHIAGSGSINLFANRNYKGWSWENKLDLEYGLKRENDEIWKKLDDRLEFNTKLGKKSNLENWYYTFYVNFKTQFYQGFDYDESDDISISDFMAPAYLTLGPAYDYKPNETFSAMISPAAYKATFVLNQRLADDGEFGVEPAEYIYGIDTVKTKDGQAIRQEIGANIILTFNKELFKNVTFYTKLDLFSDYIENPENIDVDWETRLTLKVNDFLNVIIKTHLLYDDNTNVEWEDKDGGQHKSPITQFKQSVGIGLMYKF